MTGKPGPKGQWTAENLILQSFWVQGVDFVFVYTRPLFLLSVSIVYQNS